MAVIGELVVNLKAQTAEFTDSLGKSNTLLVEFGDKGEKAGKQMGSSFGEARGGLMLTEHLLGVPLPRHLNSLISKIPQVGELFASMLPVAGVGIAVMAIGKLIEKHEMAEVAIRKHAIEMEGLGAKEKETSNSMDLVNLKLDDQITKLNGGITKNRVKEALLETAIASERMAQTLTSDFKKVDEEVETSTAFFGRMKSSALEFYDVLSGGTQGYKASWEQAVHGDAQMIAAKTELHAAQNKVNDAGRMADETESQQIAKQKALGDALRERAAAEEKVGKATGTRNPELKSSTELDASEDISRANDTAKEIIRIQKTVTVAHKEDKKEETDAAERLASSNKSIIGEMKSAWNSYFELQMSGRKAAKKYGEEAAKEDEKEISSIRMAHEEIQKEASNMEALAKSKHEVSMIHIEDDVHEGKTSKIDEQAEKKKILEKEHQDLVDAHASDIAEEQRYVDALKAAANSMPEGEARTKALHDAAQAQSQLNAATAKYTVELAHNESAQKSCDNETKKLRGDFKLWITEMQRDMPKTAAMLEKDFEHAFDSMNSAMAKYLVEGKNFGKAMKQVGAQLLESVIEQELKKLEVYVLSLVHQRAAGAAGDAAKIGQAVATAAVIKPILASMAGAAGFESVMEAVPFPANVATAPVVGMEAFTSALAFGSGGKVPGYGNTDSVNAMLMPGETVVSKALTSQVERSQGGGGNGHTIQHNPTYHVSMIDASGVRGMLKQHDAEFQKHAVQTMRKMNVRASRG
jgi:hypothetical protein